MSKSTVFNYSIEQIKHMFVQEQLSLAAIAEKLNKPRSTFRDALYRVIDKDTVAQWKIERNKPNTSKIKVGKKVKPKQEKESSIKYFCQEKDDGYLYTCFIGSEHLSVYVKSQEEVVTVLSIIKRNDIATLRLLHNTYALLQEKFNITYDEVSKTYNLQGITLPDKYENLIIKGYQAYKQGNDKSIIGLVNMIHLLNSANRMDKLDQLYQFLKHNDIEILENGYFVGFKYLKSFNNSFVDMYSETIKQNIGDYVYTHENKVDPDPSQTCSFGLHVGAWDYVKNHSYIAQVVVNPLDVVSVPNDYNGMKMRTKGYYIIDILANPDLDSFKPVTDYVFDHFNKIFVR